jgi:hypothetical protein
MTSCESVDSKPSVRFRPTLRVRDPDAMTPWIEALDK